MPDALRSVLFVLAKFQLVFSSILVFHRLRGQLAQVAVSRSPVLKPKMIDQLKSHFLPENLSSTKERFFFLVELKNFFLVSKSFVTCQLLWPILVKSVKLAEPFKIFDNSVNY